MALWRKADALYMSRRNRNKHVDNSEYHLACLELSDKHSLCENLHMHSFLGLGYGRSIAPLPVRLFVELIAEQRHLPDSLVGA